jgi:hypothetical protein
VLVAAAGPWGLLGAWPLAIILTEGLVRLVQERRNPIDTEVRRVSNEMWAAQSAGIAHDPHPDEITASLSVRRPRRLKGSN